METLVALSALQETLLRSKLRERACLLVCTWTRPFPMHVPWMHAGDGAQDCSSAAWSSQLGVKTRKQHTAEQQASKSTLA